MSKIIKLENSLTLVLTQMENTKTVAAGIFVRCGSVNERAGEYGLAHFVEHILFKGTKTRCAKDIAIGFDRLGGHANAYTSKEMTCFYGKFLKDHFEEGFDILADMVLRPKLDETDIELEKGVICEEIAMTQDSHDELVTDNVFACLFGGHPLGRKIVGDVKSIKAVTRTKLKSFMARNYTAENTVIALCGSFEEKSAVEYIRELFKDYPAGKGQNDKEEIAYSSGICAAKKNAEQNHICMAFPSYSLGEEDKTAAVSLLGGIFGGTMSSRLFQKLREENGLVYSVYSFAARHGDGGAFCVYAGLSPKNEEKAISLILAQIEDIMTNEVTPEELSGAKEQQKAILAMELESNGSMLMHTGKSQLTRGKIKTPDEIYADIDAVTAEDIRNTAREIFKAEKMAFAALGQIKTKTEYKKILSK